MTYLVLLEFGEDFFGGRNHAVVSTDDRNGMKNDTGIAMLGHEGCTGLERVEKGPPKLEDIVVRGLSCESEYEIGG